MTTDYEAFKTRTGELGYPAVIAAGNRLPAHKWWHTHAHSLPTLRVVALSLLPLHTTATSSERAWSAQGVIQTAIRANLGSETQDKLVNVYLNVRLEKRLKCEQVDIETVSTILDPTTAAAAAGGVVVTRGAAGGR